MHSYGNNKASKADCCKKPPGMNLESNAKEVSHHMKEMDMSPSLGDAYPEDLKKGYCSKGAANTVMGPHMVDSLEDY